MKPQLADSTTINVNVCSELRELREIVDLGDLMAGSLGIKDIFRAVSRRLCETVNCCRTKLWLLDEKRSNLRTYASWPTSENPQRNEKAEAVNRIPQRCFTEKQILIDDDEGEDGSVAIPLFRGSEIIGVLQLFFTDDSCLKETSEFENIGELVSPVIVNSVISERNRTRALTDEITELPNQRSFYLALEQHLAEAQANPDESALSILAIDLGDRSELIARVEYSGDAMIRSSAHIIHENLREMDFIARSQEDEFLVILPKATEPVTQCIITRIEEAFTARPSDIKERTRCPRVGWAVFGRDGDTAELLIARARLRKVVSKQNPSGRKVLVFPNRT